MSEITIRSLSAEDDLAPLLALCKDFLREYQAHHATFFALAELRDEYLSGRFLDSLTAERSTTLLALDGEMLVGYASLNVHDQPPFYAVREVGGISGLYVVPVHRGQGIAGHLLKAATDWLKARNVNYYTVYTATANHAALATYLAHGMTPVQTVFLGEI